MNILGLHTFAIAPVWDLDLIEPRMERLKGLGIGLLEIPLLRPEEIDTRRTRAFAERWNVELVPSLGLPASLDVVARPDEALAFLEPAFGVCKAVGGKALGGGESRRCDRRRPAVPARGGEEGGADAGVSDARPVLVFGPLHSSAEVAACAR